MFDLTPVRLSAWPAGKGESRVCRLGAVCTIDAELKDRLWHKRRIQLLPLRKDNQKNRSPDSIQGLLERIRYDVGTVFSTLTTVFSVEYPRGWSLVGHVVRIATCVLAHTLGFFMA